MLGYHSIELRGDILNDIRVSMFINHHPGRGMRYENITDTAYNTTFSYDAIHYRGDILKFHSR